MNKFSKITADVVGEMHPLFRGLCWVAAARSTDDTRFVLNHVLVEREGLVWRLVATDGRRLHVHELDPGLFDDDIDPLEEGLYKVITKNTKLIVIAKSDCEEKFPAWRGVVTDYVPTMEATVNAQTLSKIAIKSGVLMASGYVSEAVGFGHGRKGGDEVKIRFGSSGDGGAFVIQHEIGKAVVMPLRDTDEVMDEEAKTEEEGTEMMRFASEGNGESNGKNL